MYGHVLFRGVPAVRVVTAARHYARPKRGLRGLATSPNFGRRRETAQGVLLNIRVSGSRRPALRRRIIYEAIFRGHVFGHAPTSRLSRLASSASPL